MRDPIHAGAAARDAEVLCVVVHGRGQTPSDMLAAIVDRLDLPDVRFALPRSEGAAWYEARAIDPLTDRTRAELEAGLARIAALVAAERAAAPGRPLLLCGFSQGGCMAAELLLDRPGIADAACLLTACRVGSGAGMGAGTALAGLPVYASCGDADPWIPASAFHRLLDDLTEAGARIRSDLFPGRPHEVCDTEIAALSEMLGALARGARPLEAAR